MRPEDLLDLYARRARFDTPLDNEQAAKLLGTTPDRIHHLRNKLIQAGYEIPALRPPRTSGKPGDDEPRRGLRRTR